MVDMVGCRWNVKVDEMMSRFDRRLPQLPDVPFPTNSPKQNHKGIHRKQIIGCTPILPVMIASRAPTAAPALPDINFSLASVNR
jgi:hypothetical protein